MSELSREVAELARKTKEELIRRGPVIGKLAELWVQDPEWDDDKGAEPEFSVPIETCRVCLMGAAGAAVGVSPLRAELMYAHGKAYTEFVQAMSEEVRERHGPESYGGYGNVEAFFDHGAGVIDGDVSSLGKVFDLLDTIAARYSAMSE